MKWQVSASLGEKIRKLQLKVVRNFGHLWTVQAFRRKLLAFPLCLLGVSLLFSWTLQSNSCALHAFFSIIFFDVISLFGDLLCQSWTGVGKPNTSFSFGFIRLEVLTHFLSLCLGLLLNFWAIKKSFELAGIRSPSEEDIHTTSFIPGVILGGVIHFFLSFNNNPFLKVYKVSSTTTTTKLQKYFQEICATFGQIFLSSSSTSAFALSPFAALGAFSISTILVLVFALQTGQRWLDFVGSVLIIIAMLDTLWPLTIYTAQVLLQTVPAHIVSQLEKSLREALTIDGVLEFRNELFWTLTYGQVAGALHVRVRRDANEQLVLSKVFEKLQPLAPHLTVQVTKDDFGRPFGNLHLLRDLDSSLSQVTIGHSHNHSSELSPIPNALGHVNHLIYTASARNQHHSPDSLIGVGISSTPRFDESPSTNASVHMPASRSVLSSSSSSYQPTEINIYGNGNGANGSGNHLNVPTPGATRGHHHHHHHHAPTNNGRQGPTPINDASNVHHPMSQNSLISSANFFE